MCLLGQVRNTVAYCVDAYVNVMQEVSRFIYSNIHRHHHHHHHHHAVLIFKIMNCFKIKEPR
jgi:hypothetical protein